MKFNELKELILDGECSTIEFKRKIPSLDKIAKAMSAFANTIGGYLIIGVDDYGSLVGVHSEKSDIDYIQQVCMFNIEPPIEPEIEIVNHKTKEIIVVYISESNQKPHFVMSEDEDSQYNKRVYIRVGNKSVVASREMVRLLSSIKKDKPLSLVIGDKEKRLFKFLDENEKATVMDFANLVNISRRRAERLLIRLVRAGVIQIHIDSNSDYFTLVENIK